MNKVKSTLEELNFPSEQVELFFQKMTENLQGFEEEVEQKIKEGVRALGG